MKCREKSQRCTHKDLMYSCERSCSSKGSYAHGKLLWMCFPHTESMPTTTTWNT